MAQSLKTKNHLTTTSEVMDALGGTGAVAALFDDVSGKAACNWRNFEHFPPKTYLVMTAALEQISKTAPRSLWGMVEPARRREKEKAA